MGSNHLRPPKKPKVAPPKPELRAEDIDLWRFWDRVFEIPWRDVKNPVTACAALAQSIHAGIYKDLPLLFEYLATHTHPSYWDIEDEITLSRAISDPAAVPVSSGLRCLQLAISKSDGGGALYNVPLQRAVSFVTYRGLLDEATVDAVLCESRARDAGEDLLVRDVVRGRYKRRLITGLYL